MRQPCKARGGAGRCSQRTHRVERMQPREPRLSMVLMCSNLVARDFFCGAVKDTGDMSRRCLFVSLDPGYCPW